MPQQPFHHGNLRTVLLDRAEQTLREGSADDLSLRDLARQAGVSHGAPRSHFVDRRSLLDALAERGFLRLAQEIGRAVDAQPPDDLGARLRAVATAYVRFAVTDASLMALMFSTKGSSTSASVQVAAEGLFSTFASLFDADLRAGRFRGSDANRTRLLFVAVLQGIASLIASGRVSTEAGDALVSDAVELLLAGDPS